MVCLRVMRCLIPLGGALLLASCATSINRGSVQNITIITPEVENASCELTDNKGRQWHVKATPGSVLIQQGDAPLTVICSKEGYKKAVRTAGSNIAKAAYTNVLTGGVGAVVDVVSGAALSFPSTIKVWMEPEQWKSESARQQWFFRKQRDEEEGDSNQCFFSRYTNC